jgi:hypothetical protein
MVYQWVQKILKNWDNDFSTNIIYRGTGAGQFVPSGSPGSYYLDCQWSPGSTSEARWNLPSAKSLKNDKRKILVKIKIDASPPPSFQSISVAGLRDKAEPSKQGQAFFWLYKSGIGQEFRGEVDDDNGARNVISGLTPFWVAGTFYWAEMETDGAGNIIFNFYADDAGGLIPGTLLIGPVVASLAGFTDVDTDTSGVFDHPVTNANQRGEIHYFEVLDWEDVVAPAKFNPRLFYAGKVSP